MIESCCSGIHSLRRNVLPIRALGGVGISILAIIFAAAMTTVAAGAAAAPPYQATGVKVGEVTQTSAIVWTRLTRNPERANNGLQWPQVKKEAISGLASGDIKSKNKPVKAKKVVGEQLPPGATLDRMEGATPGAPGEVRVVWRESAEGKSENTTLWTPVDPERDFTRQFTLKDLKPNTQYAFRVECRGGANRAGVGGPAGPSVDGHFKTDPEPGVPARVVFTVNTGQSYADLDDPRGYKIYPHMLSLKPDFFVHTGDILYYDGGRPVARSVALARYKWNEIYSLPRVIEFHREVPSYFEKDDHDTWQNDCWPTLKNDKMGEFTFKQGQAIFLEQVPMGEHTWRTVRWGKDLQIWLPEGRDFRSPNTDPDGPNKSIWGAAQKAWFKKTVAESDATFRVLISPTPIVGPDRESKNDNHANAGFKHEGDELRSFVASQKNMVIVCGDRHWQYVSVDPVTGAREYSCGPASDEHAGGWSHGLEPEYHKYLNVVGGFLAGTVERVDGKPTLTFRHYSVDGKTLNEDRLIAK